MRGNIKTTTRIFWLLDEAWGRMKARPVVILLVSAAALLSMVGFASVPNYEDQQNEASSLTNTAMTRFWAVYHGNDYSEIPQVQEELNSAIQDDPNNPTLYALLGATHFWHVGEASRDPIPDDPELAQDMSQAVDLFGKALKLDYYTKHPIGYIYDDHLPGYLGITTFHLGQQNDPDLMAKGDQILDFAAYQFPEFNNFNRWAAHLDDSRDSDTYKKALDSLWNGIDACIGTKLDRTNPDIRPYLDLVTAVGRKKACWWEGNIAPYSYEGYLLNLGNGLVKAGKVDQATVIFADVRYARNYGTWPYRKYFEQVANSNLYARAALYADDDPTNDPPLAVPNRSCSYCHATVPEHDPLKPSSQQ
jgi:hypothetical protein